VVCAAYSGSDTYPAWWLNLRAATTAAIQVGPDKVDIAAELATPERHTELWQRLVEMYPPFQTYRARTDRPFPIVMLYPREHLRHDGGAQLGAVVGRGRSAVEPGDLALLVGIKVY
jgi:F420H(2)-dependent quinone reductase